MQFLTQPSRKALQRDTRRRCGKGARLWFHLPNPFVARCDCAVLQLYNYSESKFPESFGELSSLAKLGVYGGKLERLADDFGVRHHQLTVLQIVSAKHLVTLPESLGRIQNLLDLVVINCSLTALPKSVGNLKN